VKGWGLEHKFITRSILAVFSNPKMSLKDGKKMARKVLSDFGF